MAWELSGDVEKFAETAGDFLRSRPVQHTTLLTLVDTLRRRGPHAYASEDPLFGTWRTPSEVVAGVLVQTPPFPMLFSAIPREAVPAAVDLLADRTLTGVNMLAGAADTFVAGWRRRTGAAATVHMRTRLYRLDALIPPPVPPPGRARPGEPGDRETAIRWMYEFFEFIGERPRDVEPLVDERIGDGLMTVWETGGTPVSIVLRSRPQAGMIRIQNVYTPPDLRGKGYAGAATAAATRAALAAGATDVVLHTDLANPTSNALYQRLGYRPIEDRTVVDFG
jgi:RimJ/RimL family protein N-acetyltransferase